MEQTLPVWVHLVDRLRSSIYSGQFENGRLPSEPELARQFEVCRGTIRRVLAQLEHEGLIVRKHGSGTYINPVMLRIASRLDEVWDFSEMIRLAGYHPEVEHIQTLLEPASELYQQKLSLDATAEVITVANLFQADHRAVIYCLDVIPGRLVREAYASQELHGPIYAFLQRRCHQTVSYNVTQIRAVNADEAIAAHMKCRLGAALHYFEEVGYNAQHQPILYSQEYYLPDVFCFQTVRRMISAQHEPLLPVPPAGSPPFHTI